MECLITKLKGVVTDSSLLKLGEAKIIYNPSSAPSVPSIEICFAKDASIYMADGDNDFYSDSTLSTKIGKSVKFLAHETKTIYFSPNKKCSIVITNKYDIKKIRIAHKDIYINVNDLMEYSTAQVEIFALNGTESYGTLTPFIKHAPNVSGTLGIPVELEGDLGDIPSSPCSIFYCTANAARPKPQLLTTIAKGLQALDREKLVGFNIYITVGDDTQNNLYQFAAFTNLATIRTYSSNDNKSMVTGSLVSLAALTKLNTLDILSSKITGTIQDIQNLPLTGEMLNTFKENKISGDLSYIPSGIYFASFVHNTGDPLTWTTGRRASTSYEALAIESAKFGDGELDKFLIDNAKCKLTGVSSRPNSYDKIISASGNRTSASDSAVSTLQSAGFTLLIPSATTMMMRSSEKWGIAYKDKELFVEPVNLSVQTIYPASDVTVKEFNTEAEAQTYIISNRLVKTNA
jgi:hypothetical protein